MQDAPESSKIKKFLEEYECMKRVKGEPCRVNGAELLKIIKKNDFESLLKGMTDYEEFWEKLARIETKMLSVFTAQDFFESLLPEIRKVFQMPYVWLTVIENTPFADLVKTVMTEKTVKKQSRFIEARQFGNFFKNGPKPLSVCKYTSPYASFFPEKHNFTVRSLLIMPLYIDGSVAGSLNFGHFVSGRFAADMHIRLIQQFMLKVSLCLSNVAAHERLAYLERYDALTGQLNRSAFMAELEKKCAWALRQEKDLSLIFFGIHGYSELNSRYGHDYGDMVVEYVSQTISALSRTDDVAGRFDAGEFALFVSGAKGDTAQGLAARIQSYLDENPFTIGETTVHPSLYYGIGSIEESNIENAADLLQTAYRRLNEAASHHNTVSHDRKNALIYKIRAS